MEHIYIKNAIKQFHPGSAILYSYVVQHYPNNSHFVEIGSATGGSISYMIIEMINSGKTFRLDSIDTWEGTVSEKSWNTEYIKLCRNQNFYYEFIKFLNENNILHKITPIKMSSEIASTLYENNSIDFIFMDADHTYESLLNNLNLWSPKLKPKGIIAGDDLHWKSVKSAVDEFFKGKYDNIQNRIWYRERHK